MRRRPWGRGQVSWHGEGGIGGQRCVGGEPAEEEESPAHCRELRSELEREEGHAEELGVVFHEVQVSTLDRVKQ